MATYIIRNRRDKYLGEFDTKENRLTWVDFDKALRLDPETALILNYLLTAFQVELLIIEPVKEITV